MMPPRPFWSVTTVCPSQSISCRKVVTTPGSIDRSTISADRAEGSPVGSWLTSFTSALCFLVNLDESSTVFEAPVLSYGSASTSMYDTKSNPTPLGFRCAYEATGGRVRAWFGCQRYMGDFCRGNGGAVVFEARSQNC
eukprot:gene18732-biopygen18969